MSDREKQLITKLIKAIIDRNISELPSENYGELIRLKLFTEDMLELYSKLLNKLKIVIEEEKQQEITEDRLKKSKVDFRRKKFWREQIEYTIEKTGRPLKSKEILECFPVNPNEKRNCMSILSIVLAEFSEKGIVKKFKIEGEKGFCYALPYMTQKKG
jgi:hypothetical protein